MAKLPNAELATVDRSKLTDYLLNPVHREGWAKGRLLVTCGFQIDEPELLGAALLDHGRALDVVEQETTSFGTKYAVDGPMMTPGGVNLQARTVWQIDTGQQAPRFVTMVPLPRKS